MKLFLDTIEAKMVGLGELTYAGSHGYEISGGYGYFETNDTKDLYLSALKEAEEELRAAARKLPGIRIERKPYALAVHYRGAGGQETREIEKTVDSLAGRVAELKKSSGRKIFELRPAVDWHKGKALQAMLDQLHVDCSQVTPLYIGDDTTDEDAFRAIAHCGIGILVSEQPRPTSAHFRLHDPSEVVLFLEKLADLAEKETARGIWTLTYEGFEPESEKLRESLCALGNGAFASRGASPQSIHELQSGLSVELELKR